MAFLLIIHTYYSLNWPSMLAWSGVSRERKHIAMALLLAAVVATATGPVGFPSAPAAAATDLTVTLPDRLKLWVYAEGAARYSYS